MSAYAYAEPRAGMRCSYMERIEVGMFAVSKAGHDAGRLYVITTVDGEYVYLADGRLKPVESPKKKKKKHIQVIRQQRMDFGLRKPSNEGIRKALRAAKQNEEEKECQKPML